MKIKFFLTATYLLLLPILANTQVKSQQECIFDAKITNVDLLDNMYPDQKDDVYITVENTGSCIWKGNEVELRVTIYKGPSGAKVQRDELIPSSPLYAPTTGYRETCKFTYTVEAPYYVGSYTLEFQMMFKGQKFGSPVKEVITIVPKK
jgi:hypothetical protein